MAQDPIDLLALDTTLRQRQERRREGGAGVALQQTIGTNPEAAALRRRAAAILGTTPEAVAADPEAPEQARVQSDMAALSGHHATIDWISDPKNAEVASDQVESLTGIERTMRQRLPVGIPDLEYDLNVLRRAPGGAIETVGRSISGLNVAGRRLLDRVGLGDSWLDDYFAQEERVGRRIALGGRNAGGNLSAAEEQQYRSQGARNLTPQARVNTGLMGDVSSGVGQIGGQVLIGAATGGYGSLPSLFGQGASAMDDRVRESQAREGRTDYSAQDDIALFAGATVTALSEKIGLDAILGRLPKTVTSRITGKLADILIAGATEGGSEIVEGVGQNALAKYLLGEDTGLLDGSVESGTVGATVGLMARSLVLTAIPGRQHIRDTIRSDMAEPAAQGLDELVAQVGSNPILKRDPEAMRAFLSQVSPDGTVYVPAEAMASFFQSSPDLEPWLDEWGVRDQYDAALVSGADVAIPTADYLAKVGQTEAHAAWRDEVRLGLEAMSVREANEFKGGGEDALNADLDARFAEAEAMGNEAAPASAVYDNWFRQSREAGYTVDVARTQATLVSSYFSRRAANSGGKFADAMQAFTDAGVSIRQEFPQAIRERMDRTDVMIEGLRQARAPAGQRAMFGRSLAEFVSQEGGIVDTGGELQAMGADQWHRGQRFRRKLIRGDDTGGKFGSDYVTQRAVEAGFLKEGSTGDDLFNALREEMAGRPAYSQSFESDPALAENRQALDELEGLLGSLGMDVNTSTNAEIKTALERAAGPAEDIEATAFDQGAVDPSSAAFKAWFGDSKVVDENGEPLVVYHGMKGELEGGAFDPERIGDTWRADERGFFFLDSAKQASDYARQDTIGLDGDVEGAAVVPVYISLQKPLVIDPAFLKSEGMARTLGEREDVVSFWDTYQSVIYDWVDERGADGVILRDPKQKTQMVVAFRPEQIKSVFNRGTFDPADPRILYQQSYEQILERQRAVEGLRAAIRDPLTGELFTGASHQAIINAIPATDETKRYSRFSQAWDDSTDDVGFVLRDGTFINRDQANERYGFGYTIEDARDFLRNRGSRQKWYQRKGDGGPRGQIAFSEAGAAITVFKSRDLSTFFHEFGHLTLELMIRDASDPSASDQVKNDLRLALDYMNLRDPADIGVDQHELWARSLEAYLMEGRSPSIELRSIFKTIKGWMLSVYRTVLNLNAPISDEVRGVFDRMLASDEEIEAAKIQLGIEAGFTDAAQAGMTPEAFADYQAKVQRAREASEDDLLQRVMRAIRRERTAEWKAEADAIRPDVTEEMDRQPDLAAVNWLRASKVSLNREIVVRMMGDEAGLSLLPKGVPPLVGKNGVHPDAVAEVSGYKSGADLLNGLMEYQAERLKMKAAGDNRSIREARIEREITERLRENLGDPLSDGSIEAEAMAALHGDRQADVLGIELGVLGRRVGQTPAPIAHLRAWAAEQIGSRTVREARSGKYLRAERKAANAAQKAIAADDRAEAFRQKQAQTMNHLLYSEARRAEEYAERALRRLSTLDSKRTIKSMDQDYLDQIHALLEQYDLRPASGRQLMRRKGLMEFVTEQQFQGNEVVVPPALLEAAKKKHYSELTVDELRALDDTIASLAHLGRFKQDLLDNRERRSFTAVIDEMLGQVFDLPKRKGQEGRNPKPNALRQIDAALWKTETMADWLDRDDVNGVFNRVLIRPAVDASNTEDALHQRVGERIRAEYAAIPKKQRKRWTEKVTVTELIDEKTGQASVFDRSDLLAMALNVGNASNLDKLTRGENWTPEDVMTVLNRELSVEEWTMVQGIWDALETLWPDIARVERRLTGVEPERVIPTPVQTIAGELRGGYYPVVYDPKRRANAQAWAAQDAKDLFSGVITGAATSKGHTETRTAYAGPILLSVEGVLFGHMNKVIKRIAFAEYVQSAQKFITDDRVRQVVTDKLGPEYYDQLMPWLQGMVTDRGGNNNDLKGVEGFVRAARLNFQMVAMGFRATTGLAQVAGFAQSASQVDNVRLAKNIAVYAKEIRLGRNHLTEMVWEKSGEMKGRQQSLDRDLRDAMRDLIGKAGPLNAVRRAAFMHISIADQMVSVPTWMAGYETVIENGGSEEDAIAAGDKAVRKSQGVGREYALAAIQRPNSEWMKAFTLFYSYFSVQYQRQRDVARYATTGDPVKAMTTAWWVLFVAPVLGALLTGEGPEDDDEEDGIGWEAWASWMGRKFFFNLFSGVPIVRDISSTAERKVAGKFSKYSPTPLGRAYEGGETLTKDITDLLTGEEVSGRWLKHAIETPGYFVGLPTGQAANTSQYLYDFYNEDQQPENAGEFLYGLMKGSQENQE